MIFYYYYVTMLLCIPLFVRSICTVVNVSIETVNCHHLHMYSVQSSDEFETLSLHHIQLGHV